MPKFLRVKADGANFCLPRGKAVDCFKAGDTFEVTDEEHKRLSKEYDHILEQGDAPLPTDPKKAKAADEKLAKWQETLQGMKREALAELCKKRGIKTEGTNVAAMIGALKDKPED